MGNKLLTVAPVLALIAYLTFRYVLGFDHLVAATLAVTLLTGLWWIFESLPIWTTAMVPLCLLPLLGVITQKQAAAAMGSPLILLMLGAFLLSAALERSGAHRRLALIVARLAGGNSPRRLTIMLMVLAAALSMWISNTATLLMLMPIILPMLSQMSERQGLAMILGLAYACTLGGMGTPVGTPPNAFFAAQYLELTGNEYDFFRWMQVAVPAAITALPLIALWLTRGQNQATNIDLPPPGNWTSAEKRVLIVFAATALLWMTRTAPFDGWQAVLGLEGKVNDATVAIVAAILVFFLRDREGSPLLDWETAQGIHWGVLLLFAGGLCIATAFKESGVSALIGAQLTVISDIPLWVAVPLICLAISFLTEITTNTATTTLLLPIFGATAISIGLPPETLMIPITLSASCAFMLPCATAPNAIIFSTGKVHIRDMAREGFVVNLIAACCVSFWHLVVHWPS